MRREPVTIAGLEGALCSNIRLSHRLKWRDQAAENEHLMVPALLAVAMVDQEGKPIKTVDEWDQWAGDNTQAAETLFEQCIGLIGTVEEAKKK